MNFLATEKNSHRVYKQRGFFIIGGMIVFLVAMGGFALYITERMGKSLQTDKRREERVLRKSINSLVLDGMDCCQTLQFAQVAIDNVVNSPATDFPCENESTSPADNPLMNAAGIFVNAAEESAATDDRWYRSIEPLYSDGASVLEHETDSDIFNVYAGYFLKTEDAGTGVGEVGMNVDVRCAEVQAEDGTPLLDADNEQVVALMLHSYTKVDNRERNIDNTYPTLYREIDAVAACWPIFKCGYTRKCGSGSSYTGNNTPLRDLRSNPNYILNPCYDGALSLFVSSATTDGSIAHAGSGTTGVEAADAICQQEGENANPGGGLWQALLSTSSIRAKDRVNISATVNNSSSLGVAEIAVDYADFWAGGMVTSISYRADGSPLGATTSTDHDVWTGSSGDSEATAETCSGWTSTSGQGTFGQHTKIGNTEWLEDATANCNQQKRIYCLGFAF